MTLHFILAQISQLSSLSLLQQELGLNHQPLNASPPAALHSAPCYLDFFVILLEYKTKTTLRICVSNVLATLAQCEALLWTFFFCGARCPRIFFVCVLINSSSVSCHHWYRLAHWWKCFLGCYEKRLGTDPPLAIGLLQSPAANEEALRPVNLFLSLTLPAPQMNMHNLHMCEPLTFKYREVKKK